MPRLFNCVMQPRALICLAGCWLSACSSGATPTTDGAVQTGSTAQAGTAPAAVGGSTGSTGSTATAGAGSTGQGTAGRVSTTPNTASGSAGSPSSGAAGSSTAQAAGTGAAGEAGTAAPVAAGSGGAAGSAPTGIALTEKCEGGSLEACSSFVTSAGVDVTFGPYGAIMEPNVGAGFENTIASGDADDNATCTGFTALFGSDPEQTAKLLDTGDLNFGLYTLYRPVNLVEGETYPIITWGNGTCAAPEGYGTLLRYVASHGFFIIAPNSRWVGSGEAQRKGIDFMLAANEDSASPLLQEARSGADRSDGPLARRLRHSHGYG